MYHLTHSTHIRMVMHGRTCSKVPCYEIAVKNYDTFDKLTQLILNIEYACYTVICDSEHSCHFYLKQHFSLCVKAW